MYKEFRLIKSDEGYELASVRYGIDGAVKQVQKLGIFFQSNSGTHLGHFLKEIQEAFQQRPIVWETGE